MFDILFLPKLIFPVGPVISTQPRSLRVREGTSARFSCAAEGNPAPRYAWYRLTPGQERGPRVGEAADLELVASAGTAGRYQCEASAGPGTEVTSEVVSLDLYTRPVIAATKASTEYRGLEK